MRTHRTQEQWQALVDQQQISGLSAPRFCQQHGVSYPSFCNWRKRLSSCETSLEQSTGAGFLDLSSLMGSTHALSTGWTIVLSLGNGVELRLSQNG